MRHCARIFKPAAIELSSHHHTGSYSTASVSPAFFINLDDCLDPDNNPTEVLGMLLTALTLSKHPCVLVSRALDAKALKEYGAKQHGIHGLSVNPIQILSLKPETLELSVDEFNKLGFAECLAAYARNSNNLIHTEAFGHTLDKVGRHASKNPSITDTRTYNINDSRFLSKQDPSSVKADPSVQAHSYQIHGEESLAWFNTSFINRLRKGHDTPTEQPARAKSFGMG